MTSRPGSAGPADAELVSRVLAADREAFALVYDRYGPRLYDFAYSMLRHREDAADAVADSFVLFAERLTQLRDPDRLRPWLYAIVRSECLHRLKARKRIAYGDEEQLIEMADDAITPEQAAERAALQKLVWDAAAGLADRDRALLDLHLRQGLEGAELGEAMGVSAANTYVMLNRLRSQVDRSLGALLIARLGRDDCAELDDLLTDWDGTFSPLIRKRVARHIEKCPVCGERRKRIVSPWMLLAGVPMFAAPLGLRDRVLNDTQLVAHTVPGGPAAPTTVGGQRWSTSRALVATVAVALLAIVAVVLLWPGADGDPAPLQATPTPSATLPTEPVSPTPTTDPTTPAPEPSDPSTPTPTPTESTTPSPTLAAPAALTLSTRSIELGTSGSRGTVKLGNSGDLSLDYRVASRASWLTVSPSQGTLAGGDTGTVVVRAQRAEVPEGRATGSIVVTWAGGTETIQVSLTQERAPVVGTPVARSAPSCTNQTVTVTAPVSDESRIVSVVLTWIGPHGSGSAQMTSSGSSWSTRMGPFTLGGDITMRVTATDERGNTATGPVGTTSATPCPQ